MSKRIHSIWKCAACVCSLGLGLTVNVLGVKTSEVHQYAYTDFIDGDLNALSLSQHGVLRLGHELKEIAELSEAIVFDAVADSQGNLYLGAGNEGTVYRITAEGEVETIFSTEEILIRALAVDSEDAVYVGTAPDGRVYRLRSGENPEVYFDPEAAFIWDMIIDDENNLYVSTGSPAKIFKVPAGFNMSDEAELLFETNEEHIPVIVLEADGVLLAGTSPSAFLYRVVPGDTKGSVLYNADADEITAIFSDENDIFFATMTDGNESGEQTPMDLPQILEKMQSFKAPTGTPKQNGAKASNGKAAASEPARSGQSPSFIYRLQPNGFAEPLWSPGSANIFSMAKLGDMSWLVGTDTDGRLYAVKDTSEWMLYQRAPKGGDVSVLLKTGGSESKLYVITSNPAVVYVLSDATAEKGSFESSVMDATQTARWGHLRMTGAGNVSSSEDLIWSTRSGNVPEPDDTWSEWAVAESMKIQSPSARYLQYKVELISNDVWVDDVRLFYSLYNVAPIVSRVNVLPIGIDVFDVKVPRKPNVNLPQLLKSSMQNKATIAARTQTKQQFRITGEHGFMSFVWDAVDPNGDSLLYKLELKKEDEPEWSVLAEDIPSIAYSINTRGYEDGYYSIRVIADDSEDNPEGEGKQGQRISYPFLIDNGSPTIRFIAQEGNTQEFKVSFSVEDAFSIIDQVSYIIDGQALRPLLPTDIHYDQQQEEFELILRGLEPGAHSLIIEAEDELDNHATLQLSLSIDI